mmetsp:Transcript_4262/g.8251  ORF Transcript_4262/g.8251 Transcript_4262/m.8251 type:complete len:174 (+) Transcript_4262:1384-1905(+)
MRPHAAPGQRAAGGHDRTGQPHQPRHLRQRARRRRAAVPLPALWSKARMVDVSGERGRQSAMRRGGAAVANKIGGGVVRRTVFFLPGPWNVRHGPEADVCAACSGHVNEETPPRCQRLPSADGIVSWRTHYDLCFRASLHLGIGIPRLCPKHTYDGTVHSTILSEPVRGRRRG